MLRRVLLWFATLLVMGGVAFIVLTHSFAGIGPAMFGAVLLVSLLIERYGYKRVLDRTPGPDWQPTGERFLEPVTDVPVVVYFQPATGKRVYVRNSQNA